jgi:alpha-1,2-mannosyltransferase
MSFLYVIRREKNHPLQIYAFQHFLNKYPQFKGQVKLVLIGSIRNDEDQGRVDNLKSLAKELKVQVNHQIK